jgi:hypothetical protein
VWTGAGAEGAPYGFVHAVRGDRAELSSPRLVIPSLGKMRYRCVPIVR